jgi:Flp pilus assembly protein TadD
VDPDAPRLDRIEALLRSRNLGAAEHAARQFTTARPDRVEGHVLLGRCLQLGGRFEAALSAVAAAERCVPRHPANRLLYIECLVGSGSLERALQELQSLAADADGDARVLQDVGAVYSHLNRHVEAERCYGRAVALAPRDPRALYNWATCLIALGRLSDAEEQLTRVIALAPTDYDAEYNRSTLRQQTPEHNHVAELELKLACSDLSPPARVALGYALAKELEDLGRHDESFAALTGAAATRRRQLSYRVEEDLAAMAEIAREFGAAYCGAEACARGGGWPDARPLFIVGLPRSGTTLVDRILSSHSRVRSRGESSELAAAVLQIAGSAAVVAPSGASAKLGLIRRAARVDPAAIGRAYCERLPDDSHQHPSPARLIDKTPLNFLYVGLIARALPNATIVHVRRGPLDVCYAMYKTLFRMAYPFSYDLQDLARYYLAYARLLQHWRTQLGHRLIEIDYEELVADQASVTRRLLGACALPWEDACLDFHRNESPSLTASAAQVRRPLYTSSVGLWRRYEAQLQPLVRALRAGGVAVP